MKKITILRSLLAAGLAFWALAVTGSTDRLPSSPPEKEGRSDSAPAASKLIVHEWGTFTGVVGSDGVHLPFTSEVGVDLPSFVMNRPAQAAQFKSGDPALDQAAAAGAWAALLFSKSGLVAAQRMETPVVYFYTDAPRDVEVRVDFPQGLITEFYPPVRAMGPAYESKGAERFENSFLDWGRVRLMPDPQVVRRRGREDTVFAHQREPAPDGVGSRIPVQNSLPLAETNHYEFARETDSAVVQFTPANARSSDKTPAPTFEEKFLFYRGLGNFTLPLVVTSQGNDRFLIQNSGPDAIPAVFLVRLEGERVRFTRCDNLRGVETIGLPTNSVPTEDLSDAIVEALVSNGLYDKEARAMVKTWRASWFRERGTGTRLLYVVPRPATDSLLPLSINPTPDETVRLLVGRVDVLTPEQEGKIASMLGRAGNTAGIAKDEANDLRALGRFLQPAIERVTRTQTAKLLAALSKTDG